MTETTKVTITVSIDCSPLTIGALREFLERWDRQVNGHPAEDATVAPRFGIFGVLLGLKAEVPEES
jgi:hypothetical protein